MDALNMIKVFAGKVRKTGFFQKAGFPGNSERIFGIHYMQRAKRVGSPGSASGGLRSATRMNDGTVPDIVSLTWTAFRC